MNSKFSLVLGAIWLAVNVVAGVPAETPKQHDARMGWRREAKFGMFIHWGVYSMPAGEWDGKTDYAEWIMESAHNPVNRYEQFAKVFNPVKFDAQAFVKNARDARFSSRATWLKWVEIWSGIHSAMMPVRCRLSARAWGFGR